MDGAGSSNVQISEADFDQLFGGFGRLSSHATDGVHKANLPPPAHAAHSHPLVGSGLTPPEVQPHAQHFAIAQEDARLPSAAHPMLQRLEQARR